jgi:hypothetical protein
VPLGRIYRFLRRCFDILLVFFVDDNEEIDWVAWRSWIWRCSVPGLQGRGGDLCGGFERGGPDDLS